MKGGEMMELKTMTLEYYDKSIAALVSVDMIKEYLVECEVNETVPDIKWLRQLLDGRVEYDTD